MIYFNREEVERIGNAGSFRDSSGSWPCYRYLSSFWLYVEQEDRAFTPHAGSGYWEAWITCWMSREFDRHDAFVDVGANVGYYTMLAATHGLSTLSIEPQSKLAGMVKESVQKNRLTDRVTIFNNALGEREGVMTLIIPDFHSGGASLSLGELPGGITFTQESVKVIPFDYIKIPLDHRILVKIDAEGAEPQVIEGMRRTLVTHHMTIILEWESSRWKNPLEFAQELERIGPLSYVNDEGDEVPVSAEELEAMRSLEMVVVRNRNARG